MLRFTCRLLLFLSRFNKRLSQGSFPTVHMAHNANKMDYSFSNYSPSRFEAIKQELQSILASIGICTFHPFHPRFSPKQGEYYEKIRKHAMVKPCWKLSPLSICQEIQKTKN